jgi:hypothetical protein
MHHWFYPHEKITVLSLFIAVRMCAEVLKTLQSLCTLCGARRQPGHPCHADLCGLGLYRVPNEGRVTVLHPLWSLSHARFEGRRTQIFLFDAPQITAWFPQVNVNPSCAQLVRMP